MVLLLEYVFSVLFPPLQVIQDKTKIDYELRLGKLDWLCTVAIARRVICANNTWQ